MTLCATSKAPAKFLGNRQIIFATGLFTAKLIIPAKQVLSIVRFDGSFLNDYLAKSLESFLRDVFNLVSNKTIFLAKIYNLTR